MVILCKNVALQNALSRSTTRSHSEVCVEKDSFNLSGENKWLFWEQNLSSILQICEEDVWDWSNSLDFSNAKQKALVIFFIIYLICITQFYCWIYAITWRRDPIFRITNMLFSESISPLSETDDVVRKNMTLFFLRVKKSLVIMLCFMDKCHAIDFWSFLLLYFASYEGVYNKFIIIAVIRRAVIRLVDRRGSSDQTRRFASGVCKVDVIRHFESRYCYNIWI